MVKKHVGVIRRSQDMREASIECTGNSYDMLVLGASIYLPRGHFRGNFPITVMLNLYYLVASIRRRVGPGNLEI